MPKIGSSDSFQHHRLDSDPVVTTKCLAAAGFVAVGYALPLFSVLITNAQYVLFANESIAYRYFVAVRILDGEGASAWLPQGQLLTLLQQGIVLWLTKISGMSPGDIEHTLQPFGLATCSVVTALGAALLFYGITNRHFTVADKIILAFAAFVPILVTRANGFYYSTLPDYYFLTMVLALAYLVIFIGLERKRGPLRWQEAIWLGVFCGSSLANKITLVSLAGIIAAQLAIVAFRDGTKNVLICLSAFGLATFMGFFGVFFAVYLGHATDAIDAVRNWYNFGINAGREVGFEQFIGGLFVAYKYHLVLIAFGLTLVFSTSIVALHKDDRRSRGLLLGAIGLMAAFVMYAVYRRPAGTTLYEASVILTVQAAMMLVILHTSFAATCYTVLLASSALIYSAFTFNYHFDYDAKERSRRLADTAWKIHNATLNIREPWELLIPDNSYGWGGVEELIVKGTSDFSWQEVQGAKTIRDSVAPGMVFRRWPELDGSHKAFLWIIKADDRGNFVENSSAELDHRANWAALETRAKEPGSRCLSWMPVPDHRVTLCVFPTPLADRSFGANRFRG